MSTNCLESLKRIDQLEELGADGRKILKLIFGKWVVFTSLSNVTGCGLL